MKKVINGIRDFLYNLTDYGLILSVVFVMAFILIWRFDILFNRDIDKKPIPSNVDIAIVDPPKIKDPYDITSENPSDPLNPIETNTPNSNNGQSDIVATINIPEGTFPSKIGDLLLNSNLINDKNTFLNRSVEMGLDTKLQSGVFEIAIGTDIDDIIKIIAKAK